jgi:phosphoribosylformimino-5-aminoimidazole carboxamide ribotide isomerase
MLIIPVIDLMGGQVVRGIAGRRSEYRPIESRLASESRPAIIARALVDQFGFSTAYVADLDAIGGRKADWESLAAIASAGMELWIDAGIATPPIYTLVHQRLQSYDIQFRLVVALESLVDPADERWDSVPAGPPLFSLDLKAGTPIHRIAAWREKSPAEIARRIHARGWSDMIVLDLADVGTGGGTRTLELCTQLNRELEPLRLIAGGGVRGTGDLAALQNAGCHAALVASALHDGRLTSEDVARFKARFNVEPGL